MIFDVLKQRWLRKEFLILENSSRDRKPYWPKSLVVIFDADQFTDLTIFNKWCKILDLPSKALTLIAYTKDVKKKELEGVQLYDKNAVKWSGGLKDPELTKLLKKKHDLQINYYDEPNEITKFITMKLDSNLKVGYLKHEESTYDLAVNVPLTDQELFISEIAKYLKIFNP